MTCTYQRAFCFFIFCRIPGPSGGACRYISWGTWFSLGTGGQLPACCSTETISTQQTARGKTRETSVVLDFVNCSNFSTQGEQSDLDSQFADIRAATEAYLSVATKPIATALRFVPI